MSIKWQRNYSLTAQLNDGTMLTVAYPLTLELSIVRKAWTSTNRCTLRVKNLAPATRQKIFRDAMDYTDFRVLQLSAGYGAPPWPRIFNGNVLQAYSYKESGSVDFITEWTGWDMGYNISTAFSNTTMAPGTSKQAVINNLVNNLVTAPNTLVPSNTQGTGLSVGYVSAFSGAHPRGRVLLGPTWQLLQQATNNACFIDNGVLNILKPNDAFGTVAFNINSDTGLLSPPRRTESYLEVEILFEPNIGCGQQVNLVSQTVPQFNGTYRVMGLEHRAVISDSVNGAATTKLLLYYQVKSFNSIASVGLPSA